MRGETMRSFRKYFQPQNTASLTKFRPWLKDEGAQTLGEYGLLLMLIALIAIVGLMLIGNTNSDLISTIANAF